MLRRSNGAAALVAAALSWTIACVAGNAHAQGKERPLVEIVTVDPGHFHAALVQKFMLPGVSPVVRVYAPIGDDLDEHLKRIERFNTRTENPTTWVEQTYTRHDWLDVAFVPNLMMHNVIMDPKVKTLPPTSIPTVVVLSGNNARKTEYITRGIEAGMNVLADKPMVIKPENFKQLEADFAAAKKKGVLLYDIMTERFEITTMLQKALSQQSGLFGTIEKGTADNPAITKISVHNFSKVVAGAQLKRPMWFFDPEQQGAGIVDVMTHLVDLAPVRLTRGMHRRGAGYFSGASPRCRLQCDSAKYLEYSLHESCRVRPVPTSEANLP